MSPLEVVDTKAQFYMVQPHITTQFYMVQPHLTAQFHMVQPHLTAQFYMVQPHLTAQSYMVQSHITAPVLNGLTSQFPFLPSLSGKLELKLEPSISAKSLFIIFNYVPMCLSLWVFI